MKTERIVVGFVLVATLLVALTVIGGCSTIAAYKSDTATQAEKKAALCSDSQRAYLLSVAAMDLLQSTGTVTLSAETAKYWSLYKSGASAGIAAYCGD